MLKSSIIHLAACVGNINKTLLPLLAGDLDVSSQRFNPRVHQDLMEMQANFKKLVNILEALDGETAPSEAIKNLN